MQYSNIIWLDNLLLQVINVKLLVSCPAEVISLRGAENESRCCDGFL